MCTKNLACWNQATGLEQGHQYDSSPAINFCGVSKWINFRGSALCSWISFIPRNPQKNYAPRTFLVVDFFIKQFGSDSSSSRNYPSHLEEGRSALDAT